MRRLASLLNFIMTSAAMAALLVISGGVPQAAWASIAPVRVDMTAFGGIAKTSSLSDGFIALWTAASGYFEAPAAALDGVKEDQGGTIHFLLNRELNEMKEALYAGDFIGLATPIAMVFGAIIALRVIFSFLLRKPRKARTSRSDTYQYA